MPEAVQAHDFIDPPLGPPGTRKWNKIEDRLFSFITRNWRGKPPRSFRTSIPLIAATTSIAGLAVRAEFDPNKSPRSVKISDAQLAAARLARHAFHGGWNYTIGPQESTDLCAKR